MKKKLKGRVNFILCILFSVLCLHIGMKVQKNSDECRSEELLKEINTIMKYKLSREYWIDVIMKCAKKENPKVNLYYLTLNSKAMYDFGFQICGQPINLMIAQKNVESDWKFHAKSHKNARGVNQIMKSTGKIIAKSLGYDNFGTWMLHHPTHSERFYAKLLWWLRKKYKDDPVLYLTAYGYGEGRVDGWLKKYGGVPKKNQDYYRLVRDEVRKVTKYIKELDKHREKKLGDTMLSL